MTDTAITVPVKITPPEPTTAVAVIEPTEVEIETATEPEPEVLNKLARKETRLIGSFKRWRNALYTEPSAEDAFREGYAVAMAEVAEAKEEAEYEEWAKRYPQKTYGTPVRSGWGGGWDD